MILHRFLLVAVSSLIALVLAELGFRVIMSPEPTIRFQQDVDELEQLDLGEATRMIENHPDFFWQLVPGKRLPHESWPFFGIISNEQSLREAREIPWKKPPGQIRILFLGDSCTFGYGVGHEQTFVEVVQSKLEDLLPGSVECINAGVPGYTVFQGYRYLVTKGLDFQPDLVVVNFGWNDTGEWDDLGDREHHAILKAMQPPGPLGRSRLCQAIWRSWNMPDSSRGDREKRPRLLPEEFSQTLDEIHDLLSQREIPLLVLAWPMRANTRPEIPAEARTPPPGRDAQAWPATSAPNRTASGRRARSRPACARAGRETRCFRTQHPARRTVLVCGRSSGRNRLLGRNIVGLQG